MFFGNTSENYTPVNAKDSVMVPDDKVVSLNVARNEPVEEVVQLLENLLEDARSGRIIGIAFAAALTGRSTGTAFVLGGSDLAVLHMAMSRLQMDLLLHGEVDYDED